jgi:hypothetical protein
MNNLDELYNELLFAVESKYPNETRHETALRYIRERETNRRNSGVPFVVKDLVDTWSEGDADGC